MTSPKRTAAVVLKFVFPLTLAAALAAAVYLRFYSGLVPVLDPPSWPAYITYLALTIAVWTVIETRLPLASTIIEESSLARWFGRLAQVDALTLAVVSAGAFFWGEYSFSRYTVGTFWILHLLAGLGLALTLRTWWFTRYGREEAEVWLATDEIHEPQLREYAREAQRAIQVNRLAGPHQILERLESAQATSAAREVLIALGSDQLHLFPKITRRLRNSSLRAGILFPAERLGPVERRASLFVIPVKGDATETPDYAVSKRIFDLVVATAGALFLAPVMLTTAVAIGICLGRPVLLSQQRVGRGDKRFSLYKFRTLPAKALAQADHEWTVAPSSRLAAFFRFTGLDELPQLFNVIRGDMSLVGPRPERPHFVQRFESDLPFYATRHRLQAGITGWAQVNGWRGNTSIARRVEYDLYYLSHWSLGFDLWILAITLAGFARNVWDFARAGAKARHAGAI